MSTTSPTKIRRIAVIDDDKEAREAMAEIVTDASFQPVIQEARLNSLNDLIGNLHKQADAAIFDHRLTPRNYAAFQGAEAVAALYEKHFPALLITAWSIEDIDNIRPYRRKIPVMIKSGGLEAKIIQDSILKCLNEFQNNYTKERIPHRVLLRVEDVDTQFIYIIIPSWDPRNGLKLPKKIFPREFGKIKPGVRLYAEVNIGALKNEDLYFDKFEIAEKPDDSYANLIRA
jgi:CheY-like chemotaxis protein